MKKQYTNEYGNMTIESVSDLLQVKEIRGANIPVEYKFDIGKAEQVALITGNRHIQIGSETLETSYLILHADASHAYICRIVSLEFTGEVDPAQELDKLNKYQYPSIYDIV